MKGGGYTEEVKVDALADVYFCCDLKFIRGLKVGLEVQPPAIMREVGDDKSRALTGIKFCPRCGAEVPDHQDGGAQIYRGQKVISIGIRDRRR